jgi:serine/threonine protein kinase
LSQFALKVLKEFDGGATLADSAADGRKEALRELKIMRGLHHPHVVKLMDSFDFHGQLHLVLELCEGGDLKKYLNDFK